MSLTIYQVPNQLEDANYINPHSSNSNAYFTCKSSLTSTYYDLKYHFRIYDDIGMIFEMFVTPAKDGLGIFNIKDIISTYTNTDLDEVTTVTATTFLKEYKISVQEHYTDTAVSPLPQPADHGSETFATKSLAGNLAYNQNDSLFPYEIENDRWADVLSNQVPKRYMKVGDGAIASFYISGNTNIEAYTKIRYHLYTTNGNIYVYELLPLSSYTFTNSNLTIGDAANGVLKIPIGLASLNDTTIEYVGYILNGTSTLTAVGGNVAGILAPIQSLLTSGALTLDKLHLRLQDGDTATDETDVVSSIYYWKFRLCDNKEITLNWENSYGGIDFFSFNMIRNDSIINKGKTYKHTNNDITSNRIHGALKNSNVSIYESDKRYYINIKTDYLTADEVDLFKGLLTSDNVMMWIDDKQIPVINMSSSQPIPHKEKPKFVMFNIKCEVAKIIR